MTIPAREDDKPPIKGVKKDTHLKKKLIVKPDTRQKKKPSRPGGATPVVPPGRPGGATPAPPPVIEDPLPSAKRRKTGIKKTRKTRPFAIAAM